MIPKLIKFIAGCGVMSFVLYPTVAYFLPIWFIQYLFYADCLMFGLISVEYDERGS